MITLALNIAALIFVAAVVLLFKALIPGALTSISDIFNRERR
jgi:hypothetical protein